MQHIQTWEMLLTAASPDLESFLTSSTLYPWNQRRCGVWQGRRGALDRDEPGPLGSFWARADSTGRWIIFQGAYLPFVLRNMISNIYMFSVFPHFLRAKCCTYKRKCGKTKIAGLYFFFRLALLYFLSEDICNLHSRLADICEIV